MHCPWPPYSLATQHRNQDNKVHNWQTLETNMSVVSGKPSLSTVLRAWSPAATKCGRTAVADDHWRAIGGSIHQSQTNVTATTAMDLVSKCRYWLDQTHSTSKCPHICNLEAFFCIPNRDFNNQPTGRTNSRPYWTRLVHNWLSAPRREVQVINKLPCRIGWWPPVSQTKYDVCPEPLQRRGRRTNNCPTGQVQKL